MFHLANSCTSLQCFYKRCFSFVNGRSYSVRRFVRGVTTASSGDSARPKRPVAYISMGTNLGGERRLSILESALSSIRREIGSLDACSCLYESLPGYDVDHRSRDEHDMSIPLHLNAVVRVETDTSDPQVILETLQRIEANHGRDRSATAGRLRRALDLDLLLFENLDSDSMQVNTDNLTLPHPRLAQRNFILFPLCDIKPDLVHPTEKETVKSLILKNLRRREEALRHSVSSSAETSDAAVKLNPKSPYTLDGNLAIPRRCFAVNNRQLWTVKGGTESAVSDTLRWIEEVLTRYGLGDNCDQQDPNLPAFAGPLLSLKRFLLRERRSPRLMGVLNVTPDSFSDGQKYYDNVEAALRHARRMRDDGADIVDVGGEATNPFVQEQVSVHSEIQRVVPVVEALRREMEKDVIISVDTRRRPVAEAATAAGADLINDVSAGEVDPDLLMFAASRGFPLVLMHSRGTPQSMDSLAVYDDVIAEVAKYLTDKTETLIKMGLPRWRLVLDVGLGFAKTADHSFEILRRLRDLRTKLPSGLPMLVGHSRKRFIESAIAAMPDNHAKQESPGNKANDGEGKLTEATMSNRDVAGLAVACWAAKDNCVDILRVHDVKRTAVFYSVMNELTKNSKTDALADFKAMFPTEST
ncbi:hydroxymethyldihydropterin pyrophosphokinase-dihydropteroate synthase, putative [Eimeria necatrix]|uniref:Hydroxymethyldihydropterin pyrophosphokinase-dihydropteroate synthase, putative n=1 Tax=Eimeria necatrix TaxID=51315 RepID=U6MDU5_9EIME|nr:hydroxymethyldihydropterin pyrophosphokinase-dihydropteroate synthase, putative [Eimeria necatrix]CDJ62181.1 hydroxymethyldihydropterin pyrophosphokinase-dihydropteroate synthase, putative [Eimeria necatrix]